MIMNQINEKVDENINFKKKSDWRELIFLAWILKKQMRVKLYECQKKIQYSLKVSKSLVYSVINISKLRIFEKNFIFWPSNIWNFNKIQQKAVPINL